MASLHGVPWFCALLVSQNVIWLVNIQEWLSTATEYAAEKASMKTMLFAMHSVYIQQLYYVSKVNVVCIRI